MPDNRELLYFEESLKDQQRPLVTYMSSGTSNLLIAFGGMRGALGIPPFEFFNITRELKCNKIFVRDLAQAYYQRGLPPDFDNINDVVNYFKDLIHSYEIENLVIVGNSMGGYAALLFGCLLQAKVVHAFAPQTYIDYWNRGRYWDGRWRRQVWSAHSYFRANRKYFDLQKILSRTSSITGQFHVHYSPVIPLDRKHAEHISQVPNVILHSYGTGGHAVVKQLRDSGDLLKWLQQGFENV